MLTLSPARYRQITIGALIALAVIIVTGAAVRLTDSGLGCDDWPNCSSERLIDVSSKHAAIEQLNRFFTGVVGIAVILAVLGSIGRRPRRHDLTVWSIWLVIGVVANAVLGGVSVLVDLHPIAIQGHLLLSMALIAAGAVLVRRAGEPDEVPRERVVTETTQRLTWLHFGLTWVAVFTGTIVTGAGPHAGDEEAERLDIAIVTAARVHSVTVLITFAVALLIAWRIRSLRNDRQALTNVMSTWIFVGALQAALGYVQYFNDVPELLVGLHVAGATLVMLVSTHVVLDTTRPTTSDVGAGSEPPLVLHP